MKNSAKLETIVSSYGSDYTQNEWCETLRSHTPEINLKWRYSVPSAGGENSTYLKNHEIEIYVMDWAGKQLSHIKKESVLMKYNYFIKMLKKLRNAT